MNQLRKFRDILEAQKLELELLIRKRDGIAIEKVSEVLDVVQQAAERELAMRNLDRESNLLRSVRGALKRVEEKTYGVCLQCENEISPKRLAAVPWTPFCIQCQEIADTSQAGDHSRSFNPITEYAAQRPTFSSAFL